MSKRTLTPVFDGAIDLPVRVGWYPCWPKSQGEAVNHRRRHYWNGRRFSVSVFSNDPDEHIEKWKNLPSSWANNQLYWCGLTAPYKP